METLPVSNYASDAVAAIERLRAWVTTVGLALDVVTEYQNERQMAVIRRAAAQAANQRHAELQWDSRMRNADGMLAAMMDMLRTWTGCNSLPDVMLLVLEVRTRTELASESMHAWQASVAELELAQAIEGTLEGAALENRAALVDQVEFRRVQCLIQIDLALRLLPKTAEVVS